MAQWCKAIEILMGLVLIFLRAHTAFSATYNEYLLFDND